MYGNTCLRDNSGVVALDVPFRVAGREQVTRHETDRPMSMQHPRTKNAAHVETHQSNCVPALQFDISMSTVHTIVRCLGYHKVCA